MQTTDVPPDGGTAPPPPTPPPPYGGTADRLAAGLRALRRSTSGRVVAGVCDGVGRSLGLDPLLVRVAVAVLTVFAGAGVVLYAAGWLLLAEDDGRPSIADRALGRAGAPADPRPGAPAGRRPLLGAVALVLVVALAMTVVLNSWDGTLLLVLALVALLVWLDRRPGRLTGAAATAPTVPAPTAPAPTAPAGPTDVTAAYPTHPIGGYGVPPGPPSATWPVPAPAPVPPRPPRPRSVLLPATLSVVLLALGVLGAVDSTTGAAVPAAAYPALALAVVGLGLLVGARYGRSRLLVAVGVVLALATGVASAADRWDVPRGGYVDRVVRPATAADVPTREGFRAGSVTYDLSGLDLAAAAPVTTTLSIGTGAVVVVVPRDADVTVRAQVGMGGVDLLGHRDDGVGFDRTVRDEGPDGPGGGSVDLRLRAGLGDVEVRRG